MVSALDRVLVIADCFALSVERHILLGLVPLGVVWLQRGAAGDEVGSLLAHHHGWGVDIAVGHGREDGGIRNVEAVSYTHLTLPTTPYV